MRPKKVILCVDDNEQDLSVLKFMLVTNGYRVLSATNGQEAIDTLRRQPVDLVLADHAMPQMSGDQLVGKTEADRVACADGAAGRSAEDEWTDSWRGCAAGKKDLLSAGVAGAREADERAETRTAQRGSTAGRS